MELHYFSTDSGTFICNRGYWVQMGEKIRPTRNSGGIWGY